MKMNSHLVAASVIFPELLANYYYFFTIYLNKIFLIKYKNYFSKLKNKIIKLKKIAKKN